MSEDKPTAEETIVDIMKGMEGIGGLPSNKEYLSEFMFRLKQTQQYKDLYQEKVEEKINQNPTKMKVKELIEKLKTLELI